MRENMQALSILDAIPALPPEFGVFESWLHFEPLPPVYEYGP
jgi:hypothetical protein